MSIIVDSSILAEYLETEESYIKSPLYIKTSLTALKNQRCSKDNAMIFVQGCKRIIENIEKLKALQQASNSTTYNSIFNQEKEEKKANITALIEQFINYFSFCIDPNALELSTLMLDRFQYIKHHFQLYDITNNDIHADKVTTFALRVISTLQRFIEAKEIHNTISEGQYATP